jgi:ubiquinone/menaquinone biosynthesis C-methylase UbiE
MAATQAWLPLDFILEQVLAYPICNHIPLNVVGSGLACRACGWESAVVGGDVISFAPVAYDGPRTQTRRVQRSNSLLKERTRWLRSAYRRCVPWRDWVFRDAAYWRAAIEPLRREELRVAQELLSEAVITRQKVLLELGVGFQDHTAMYQRLAEYAIFSDVYRDPAAVEIYRGVPGAFYCLINVERLPIRESSIDVLFTSHVVEHFPDRRQNLRALHRILRPGGVACHIVPISAGFALGHLVGTAANLLTLTPRLGRGIHGEYDSAWQELRHTTVKAWRALFEQCGFEVLAARPGTLGLTPLRPAVSLWLARHLGVFGSWVFVMQTIK